MSSVSSVKSKKLKRVFADKQIDAFNRVPI